MPFRIYSFIFLLFGAFLIWRSFRVLDLFGWLLISLVTYYQFRWVSPLFVTRGRRLVKIFNLAQLGEIKYASIRSPHWVDTANSLLFIPDEKVFFPDSKNAFVLELET
ncbi:MAG: hypothetical protein N4J56_001956 [Chroococcidiopsis sp. SAG 2025]|nr:hypothetical protein [Chroococcidiopsis sp. SAG 2025]